MLKTSLVIMLLAIAIATGKPSSYGGQLTVPSEGASSDSTPDFSKHSMNTDSIAPVSLHTEGSLNNPKIDLPPFIVSSYAAPLVPPSPADYEATEAPTVTTTKNPFKTIHQSLT